MSRRVIGLDAGGTKLLAGVVDEAGAVLHRAVHPWPHGATRAEILALFEHAAAEARAAVGELASIGVGLPATMDLVSGVAVGCRHLPIAGFAFRDWFASATGLSVVVDNDATLALLAEHDRGAARGVSDAVMLTIGTGIGGGLMTAGRLIRGARGAAGEPGHMTIDADGPECPGDCPGRGCLEAFVSGPALAAMGREYAAIGPDYNLGRMLAEKGELTAADVVHAARAGDPGAYEALQRMGEKLGVGLASLLNLLDPEIVVIGGGLGSDAGALLLEPAERVARARALDPGASAAQFVVAELGEDAGMLGAAMLALDGGDA
ncbi:MAG: glucokinase [Thermoleophilaceae bacterium]|jgi:glucokinase|nr:glucokinase [Thermoleophilaceae bacterium]